MMTESIPIPNGVESLLHRGKDSRDVSHDEDDHGKIGGSTEKKFEKKTHILSIFGLGLLLGMIAITVLFSMKESAAVSKDPTMHSLRKRGEVDIPLAKYNVEYTNGGTKTLVPIPQQEATSAKKSSGPFTNPYGGIKKTPAGSSGTVSSSKPWATVTAPGKQSAPSSSSSTPTYTKQSSPSTSSSGSSTSKESSSSNPAQKSSPSSTSSSSTSSASSSAGSSTKTTSSPAKSSEQKEKSFWELQQSSKNGGK